MATITSNASGNWSLGTTWVGGSVPADGDEVVIAAGHAVKMNADLSAFTGLLSVTIQGSDTTPGILYWMNGSSGYLKIRDTGTGIVGTAGANKGKILVNSDGVLGNTTALAQAAKAIILPRNIDFTYLEARIYCYEPTIKRVRFYGTKTTVTVSGDTFTGATLTNNTLVMFRSTGTLPTPIKEDILYYVSSASGSTFKVYPVGSNSDIVVTTDSGTGTLSVYTGAASGATTLNILDADLTTDTYWSTAVDHNVVNTVSTVNDWQFNTLSAVTATTVTLGTALDSAQSPIAWLVLCSRNVSIRLNTSHSFLLSNMTSGYIRSEFRSLTSVGAIPVGKIPRGYGIYNCSGATIEGLIAGFEYAISPVADTSIGGIFVGNGTCVHGTVGSARTGITYTAETYGAQTVFSIMNCMDISSFMSCVDTVCYTCRFFKISSTVVQAISLFNNYAAYNEFSGLAKQVQRIFYIASNCICTSSSVVEYANVVFGESSSDCSFGGSLYGTYAIASSIYDGNIFEGSFSGGGYHIGSGGSIIKCLFRNCTLTLPLKIASENSQNPSYMARALLENINGVTTNDGFHDTRGKGSRVAAGSAYYVPPTSFDGANHFLMVHSLQSTINKTMPLIVMDRLKVYCGAGTRTVRIRLVAGFTGGLVAGDLVMIVDYTSASGAARIVNDTAIISTVDDWSQIIECTFTQSRASFVKVSLILTRYESDARLFVWPWPGVL